MAALRAQIPQTSEPVRRLVPAPLPLSSDSTCLISRSLPFEAWDRPMAIVQREILACSH